MPRYTSSQCPFGTKTRRAAFPRFIYDTNHNPNAQMPLDKPQTVKYRKNHGNINSPPSRRTKLLGSMRAITKFNAPLGLPAVITVCLLPCIFLFAWVDVISPRLLALLSSLQDMSPVIHSVLRSLIGFAVLPWSLAPPAIALYIYQRHYDRKNMSSAIPKCRPVDAPSMAVPPEPLLVASHELRIAYHASPKPGEEERWVVVCFPGFLHIRHGYPNDESF